ncbi:UNVERIFIED_CONTAM: Flp pilus assembly protein TadB [Paenibacillus sp. PvR008]
MSLKEILLWVLLISGGCFALLYVTLWWLRKRNGHAVRRGRIHSVREGRKGKAVLQRQLQSAMHKLYTLGMRFPITSGYITSVRKRLSGLHAYDEYKLRLETMKMTLFIWGAFACSGVVLLMMKPGIEFAILALLCGVVINSLILDMAISRMEKRLLAQMIELFANVRHHYHQHGMVEEAISEAADLAGAEAGRHARLIHEALTDADPHEALERYYESAPNRFLKAFAGISYMVMEFGDRIEEGGSIYLKGLGSLAREIQLELLRRNKLDYLLKSLNVIALAPVFFTMPIERWARSSFPSMNEFYQGKWGFITKLSVYIVIIVSYFLLQKLQQTDETGYRAGKGRRVWEQKLYRFPIIRNVVDALIPRQHMPSYFQLTRLLKESGAEVKLEWLYIRRITLFIAGLVLSISTVFILHEAEKTHILHAPVQSGQMFGRLSPVEEKEALKQSEIDRKMMHALNMRADSTYEQTYTALERVSGGRTTPEQLSENTRRILQKLGAWNAEYIKWWEVLISLVAGYVAYQMPMLLLYLQRKMRRLDMRHEVYQFQTVISILRAMERMSVEEILEWLNRFSVIFKRPLQKCLLHYEHGPEAALDLLKEEAPLPEFQRLVDKLHLSLGKITIREAFDDLDSHMSYYFEQRKQEYEKIIDSKAIWGRLIGFAPMYGLIFLYLVIPLIGMSFVQMDSYYEQIQKIQ